MTDTLASVNDCSIGQFLNDGHFDLLGEPKERYKAYKEM